ncbi:mitochondrial import inner membrane translocase subunit TIM44-2-like isoform X2 [Sesamum indicum]|uniref:Mitochondrial import inner membrane translocase subunit TIM44-2-like isoform X2 n=1 Tax=Sesamum indicum TaxID=4182 RepID=A0A6I9UNN0_SESIN|nr:mitochondrial import inner membrane translocase subunit TIM44-2-like isoform X2 [Sesamum indicum]
MRYNGGSRLAQCRQIQERKTPLISSRLPRLQMLLPNGIFFRREFSVFDEFFKKIKGEVDRNLEFQQSMREIKEKAEDLKGVNEDLKVGRHFQCEL